MKRVSILITDDQWEFLKKFNELTISDNIRRAIDEYIAKIKKEKK